MSNGICLSYLHIIIYVALWGSRQYIGLDDNCFFSLHNGLPLRAPLGLTDIFGERIDHGNFLADFPLLQKAATPAASSIDCLLGSSFLPSLRNMTCDPGYPWA